MLSACSTLWTHEETMIPTPYIILQWNERFLCSSTLRTCIAENER